MSSKTNIGVTGTGSLIGQAIIKSIRRSGLNEKLELIGFDYFKDTVGSFWCPINYVLPDILKKETDEKAWIEFLIGCIREHTIRMLFIGVDFELPLFARHRELIESETGCRVLVSAENVISIANDKYRTYEFLKSNGFYHPKTYLPGEEGIDTLAYPVIVKPREGARSVGVSLVTNHGDMALALQQARDPIIQECVGTDTSEFTCGTIFFDGQLKQLIVLNRTLKAGNTYLSRYRNNYPEVISRYLKDVCSVLQPFGACNFQLRLDNEGIPKIFEINSRHSGTTYIRSLFGYMEIEYIINYVLFGSDYSFNLREGTVVRYFDEFFIPQADGK